MKKRILCIVLSLFVLSSLLPVSAEGSRVVYDGNAKQFIFEPGSLYSPTDLFPDFKDVMPGDSITQRITVRNEAKQDAKVKIFLRSLGADEASKEFLSQFKLTVKKSEENEMGYMFDAAPAEPAQLADWVYLGMLYSGGEVNLDVTLSVPVEWDDTYANRVGYLDWQFMVQEFPVEDTDPKPPQTGDGSAIEVWIALAALSIVLLFALLFIYLRSEKKRKEEKKTVQETENDTK